MRTQDEREELHSVGDAVISGATPVPETAAPRAAERRRLFVSTSSPNPNGDIHLGHLAGPFLSANIYARYRRMQGDEVFFQSGTDDFQSWTQSMAEKMGMPASEMAAKYAGMIAESCRMASIEVDHFHQPSLSPESVEIARDLVLRLYKNGHLVIKDVAAPFCAACDKSLFDVFVKGGCPYCGATACGSGCETCGSLLDGFELLDPICGRCGGAATPKVVRKLYFPLSALRERLIEYYRTVTTNAFQWAFWQRLLERGLPDFAASQFTDWGVPLPLPGFEGQCVSPWLQMTADHLASSVALDARLGKSGSGGGSREGWATFWNSADAEAVQFCGGDNSWLFGVLYPAIFLAYDCEIQPAAVLLPTQFYQLEGRTFSTSKRHAIWVRELVQKSSADVTRFYCAYTCPEVEQTTFRLREFVATVEGELRGTWESWLRGLWTRLADECGGVAPAAGVRRKDQQHFEDGLRRSIEEARLAYDKEGFSPQRATRVLCELVWKARRFGRGADYLRTATSAGEERRTGLALELTAARTLAFLAQPIMPDFSAYLWRALGYGSPISAQRWEDAPVPVPAGQPLGALADAYFPAVESLLAEA
jgi:methionyl-tRNA synthetase